MSQSQNVYDWLHHENIGHFMLRCSHSRCYSISGGHMSHWHYRGMIIEYAIQYSINENVFSNNPISQTNNALSLSLHNKCWCLNELISSKYIAILYNDLTRSKCSIHSDCIFKWWNVYFYYCAEVCFAAYHWKSQAWFSCWFVAEQASGPRQQSSRGPHGAQLGPVGPRRAPCWSHEPCYQGPLSSPMMCQPTDVYVTLGPAQIWEIFSKDRKFYTQTSLSLNYSFPLLMLPSISQVRILNKLHRLIIVTGSHHGDQNAKLLPVPGT